jgi:YidC/Oxa1 family membrane protein insertase
MAGATAENSGASGAGTTPSGTAEVSAAEKVIQIAGSGFSADLSSKGMALRNIVLTEHKDRQGNPLILAKTTEGSFGTSLIGSLEPLDFALQTKGPLSFVGTARVGQTAILKTMKFNEESRAWDVDISLENVEAAFPGLRTSLTDSRVLGTHSIFAPSVDFQELVVNHGGVVQRIHAQSDLETPDQSLSNTSFVSLGLRYFNLVVVDESRLRASTQVRIPEVEGQTVSLFLDHKLAPGAGGNNFSLKFFAGPKSIEGLSRVNPDLAKIVDLGFFDSIGKILRSILMWFQAYVGNWGIAIILLTIVVRLLVLPFNIISYKSMKAMQIIQPAMKAIREKYKDDPAAMQRETMALMKEKKVNPIGGCLPMLLQMPIFFALFQLLNVSVELYQAPFYFWIHDLSSADPFYVFPAIIGALIWVQQKLTPTPMDPAQAKVLQWMPLLFVVFMIALPAGLAIYTLVNTLFGVVQQYFFVNKASASASEVPNGLLTGKSV